MEPCYLSFPSNSSLEKAGETSLVGYLRDELWPRGPCESSGGRTVKLGYTGFFGRFKS